MIIKIQEDNLRSTSIFIQFSTDLRSTTIKCAGPSQAYVTIELSESPKHDPESWLGSMKSIDATEIKLLRKTNIHLAWGHKHKLVENPLIHIMIHAGHMSYK